MIKELREKRVKLVGDARKLLETAKTEKRELSNEENARYDKIFSDVSELRTQIETAEGSEKRDKWLADEAAWAGASAGRKTDATDPEKKEQGSEKREICWGENYSSKRRISLDGARGSDEYRSRYEQWLAYGYEGMQRDEIRALQSDVPSTGGYLLAPMQMLATLIKFVDNATLVRQKATVQPAIPAGTSLGAPSLDTDVADADWTAEVATGGEDSSLAFGKRELKPHPMAKLIKVSNTLLRATGQAEAIVTDRLAYKHQITAEKGYMTGTGVQQPLGLFTASTMGISTGRDVSTANSTTAIAADNLFEVKYSLKPQYQATAEWLFHRDAVKQLSKLKDGEGRYIWMPGLTADRPDVLLGRPLNQSEYAPNTFTTGLYVGLFGDLKHYWIVDSLGYQVQRLVELYAATNQTGFIGRMESDGMPVLEEAFARVKLA